MASHKASRHLDVSSTSSIITTSMVFLVTCLLTGLAALGWAPSSIATASSGTFTNPVKSDGADP